jgi:hypothetical protein
MKTLEKYFYNTLGVEINLQRLPEREQKTIPLYLRSMYTFKTTQLFERDILFLEQKENEYLTAEQYRKHIKIVENAFDRPGVLILEPIEAYNRKRLIEKQIAFIIPGKQMFIPQLLIDLKEFRYTAQKKNEKIQPAAQCLLLFHLLKENVEKMNFKKIAEKLNYTPMTITRVVNELADKNLCRIEGKKDKRVIFKEGKRALWDMAFPYLQTPVKRKIYIEEYIENNLIYKTEFSALSFYTNMSEDQIDCYAISKTDYLYLKKHNQINITNKIEGRVCLEIWKYAPGILADNRIVDPLSLYLTFKETKDERVEIEIDRMVARLW